MESDTASTGIERTVAHRLTSPSPSTRKSLDDELGVPVGFHNRLSAVIEQPDVMLQGSDPRVASPQGGFEPSLPVFHAATNVSYFRLAGSWKIAEFGMLRMCRVPSFPLVRFNAPPSC